MSTPLTPAERYEILTGIWQHTFGLLVAMDGTDSSWPVDHQFVCDSIADACAAIDAAVADVSSEDEIAAPRMEIRNRG